MVGSSVWGALQGEPHVGPQERNVCTGCPGLSRRALGGCVEGVSQIPQPLLESQGRTISKEEEGQVGSLTLLRP